MLAKKQLAQEALCYYKSLPQNQGRPPVVDVLQALVDAISDEPKPVAHGLFNSLSVGEKPPPGPATAREWWISENSKSYSWDPAFRFGERPDDCPNHIHVREVLGPDPDGPFV